MTRWNLAGPKHVAVLVSVVLLHLTGAVVAETGKANSMQALTELDNDRTVDLKVGDTLRITLPENATTGYRWAIDRLDEAIIEAVGSEANYAGGAVGSAGEAAFIFKVKKPGRGEIALKYWRHFEGDKSVIKRFRVQLNAQP